MFELSKFLSGLGTSLSAPLSLYNARAAKSDINLSPYIAFNISVATNGLGA